MTGTSPGPRSDHVPEAAIDAALEADTAWARKAHPVLWQAAGRAQVRAMLEAAAPVIVADAAATRRDRAEAKLADVRETVTTFLAHYGHSTAPSFSVAADLAHGVLQVIDRGRIGSEEEGRHG